LRLPGPRCENQEVALRRQGEDDLGVTVLPAAVVIFEQQPAIDIQQVKVTVQIALHPPHRDRDHIPRPARKTVGYARCVRVDVAAFGPPVHNLRIIDVLRGSTRLFEGEAILTAGISAVRQRGEQEVNAALHEGEPQPRPRLGPRLFGKTVIRQHQ